MSWIEDYPPQNKIENKIVLLLVMRGYKKKDIHFRDSTNNSRYLRYGYWGYVDYDALSYAGNHANVYFDTIMVDDEDWGNGYYYNYKIKGE
jgi:hypothetical protein